MSPFALLSGSEDATRGVGRALGRSLRGGITVLLDGGLGAGKTVLVRGIGDALGASGVRSPSFTLVNEYPTPSLRLVHADLYRLDAQGAEALGLEEHALSPDEVLIVEWPDRWASPPEDEVLRVAFSTLDEGHRLLEFQPCGEAAAAAAAAVFSEAAAGGCPGAGVCGGEWGGVHEG